MNVFELYAKLGLDTSEYENGLDDAESRASSAGSVIGGAMGALGKGAVIALGSAVAGVSALTTSAVNAYSNYEQLTGGIETLFGAGGRSLEEYAEATGQTVDEASAEYQRLIDAQDAMMAYAEQGFETAGLSTNEYMETVMGFSASLIQAVGGDTETAVELSNLAITDMADNANKMGSSMEAIQNAYRGFARGNYTMLDNLALGYGGTASEMERLILDAESLDSSFQAVRDENGQLAMSYDDIINAIHIVQTDMDITGTTAREASTTIQGSIGMAKSAFDNFVTGLADPNADIGALIDNMVQAGSTALGNLVPAVSQALIGIASALQQIAPILAQELPSLISDVLPVLIETALSLVQSLADSLPEILGVIVDVLPEVIDGLLQAILTVLPALMEVGIQILMVIGNALIENLPIILPQVIDMITQLALMLSEPKNLMAIINGAMTLFRGLIDGLLKIAPNLISSLLQVLANVLVSISEKSDEIWDFVGEFLDDLLVLVMEILDGLFGDALESLAEAIGDIILAMGDLWDDIVGVLGDIWDSFVEYFEDIFNSAGDFIDDILGIFDSDFDLLGTVNDILEDVLGAFDDIWEDIKGVVDEGVQWLLDAFDFDWELPHINLPHISVSGGEAPYGIAGRGSLPSFSIDWYKKAYSDAYILNDATIFGSQNGKLLAGGEGNGSEVIVGTQKLIQMMGEAVSTAFGNQDFNFIIPVYIGDEKIDEVIVKSNKRQDFISGGRG